MIAVMAASCAGVQQGKPKPSQQVAQRNSKKQAAAKAKDQARQKRADTADSQNLKESDAKNSSGKVELNKEYFKGYVFDTAHILASPVHWDGYDWMKAALVMGGTGAFFKLDDDIKKFVQDNRNDTNNRLANVFTPFGDGAYMAPALVAYYLQGYYFDNSKSRRVALLSMESFAVTGLFATAIKYGAGRHRPETGDNASRWDGPDISRNYAFPSGHTTTAFAIATVFASEYESEPWVPPLAYGIAAMTGLSRINDNKHWASDVFFGGALGYFTSKTILKLHRDKSFGRLAILPRIDDQETGLMLAYRY